MQSHIPKGNWLGLLCKSELPTQANVLPILKKGSKLQTVNYRPVSLTGLTCKLFEHILAHLHLECLMLDLFCFIKLLTVWHKCPSKAPLLSRIKVLEENTTWNLDRLAIQLASMDSHFFLKLLVHGTGLLSLKLCHWLYLDHIFLTISVHPFCIIP